ncbi:conserved hypothetical protein [Neospora caninum Liverpool]|nr:conserved hypothetical protein [Neospora caninum Liverpool]CBZ53977.1 conserved hypothetical protein [Neospora caninum Liverpool]|eukprot:XP_003884009.1 conserved hypothetical protein [Neospora caninum Liverpool]
MVFSLLQSEPEDDEEDEDEEKKKGHKKGGHGEHHKHAAKHHESHEEPAVQPVLPVAITTPVAQAPPHKPEEDHDEEKFMDKLSPADKEALLHGVINPAVHFPLLLHLAWKQSIRAIKHLRKATNLLDTIRGHMDGIPRDEKKVPSISAAVTIDVSGKALSIADINKKLRDVQTEAQNVESYLSSARSQINTKLAKVIPPEQQQPAGAAAH